MILQGAEEVEENLAGDLEGLDQVPLLEDGVGDARQRLLVRQLGDSEHVNAPLFRILQDLRRITIIYNNNNSNNNNNNNNGIENVQSPTLASSASCLGVSGSTPY